MKNPFFYGFLLFSLIYWASCKNTQTNIKLESGLIINGSSTISPDTFAIKGIKNWAKGAILIEGNDLVIDFQGAVLEGAPAATLPDQLEGIGILVQGERIEIKNLTVRGYKIGLLARNANELKITNGNFIYNYRPRLLSNQIKSSPYDYFNINLQNNSSATQLVPAFDEWMEYGAGIYLSNCNQVTISQSTIQHNHNGIINASGDSCIFFNNTITHQSGFGVGMKDATENKVMHNYLDWNIRGYNLGHYENTSGSGGIYFSKSCKNNVIAYNSITHSGGNYFRENQIYGNDFFPFSKDSILQNNLSPQPLPLHEGQYPKMQEQRFQGKKYILVNHWGPYNFNYPSIFLRAINDQEFTFSIFGPEGNWKIVDGNGWAKTSQQSGSVPATVVATRKEGARSVDLSLDLEFIGVEFIDPFGHKNKRGKTYAFGFSVP